jgi:hypothetical protein
MNNTTFLNAGKEEGGKCATLPCRGKATSFHTSFKEWYCYYCAVSINGKAKRKICVNGKELMMQLLQNG